MDLLNWAYTPLKGLLDMRNVKKAVVLDAPP